MIVDGICEVKRCTRDCAMVYSASRSGRKRGICTRHWGLHCNKAINLKSKDTYKKRK